MKSLTDYIYENNFHKSEIYENNFHKSEIFEKLVISKDYEDPDCYFLNKCKDDWDNIFDDIHELKTGNIRLGKIKLNDKNIKQDSSYKNSVFTLYVKTPDKNEIIIRRTVNGMATKWIVFKKYNFENIDELFDALTEKIKKLLSKEGYKI